ncbi:MAG: sigma-54 dependent transcriptional regulator [Vicinamibacterales bacterium]
MSERPLLLVADDEPAVLNVIERFAKREGFDVVACPGGQVALDGLRGARPDLLLVDVRMPDVSGLEVLKAIRQSGNDGRVVLMSGMADVNTVVAAIKAGAQDFLMKPLDFDQLARLLRDVREEAERRRSVLALDSEAAERLGFNGMIGRSPVMEDLFSLIRRLAPHARTVLITGETGSGKELVAKALHARGPRGGRRLVVVNCSAIVPTLFESELFGHVRGAFTGAAETKVGLFDHANGATIFLDEVGELPLSVQSKLLRVLENGEFQRVGSLEVRKVDVHILAATNRDIAAEVTAGRFREDLYYRLNVLELQVPPLRDRREDIPYLVAGFTRDISARMGKRITGITSAAERALMAAAWQGNVRELRNTVERACVLAEGPLLSERELHTRGVAAGRVEALEAAGPHVAAPDPQAPVDAAPLLRSAERDLVRRVLDESRGNKKAAAATLGISRRALYRLLERHGLDERICRRSAPAAGEGAGDAGPDDGIESAAVLPVAEAV